MFGELSCTIFFSYNFRDSIYDVLLFEIIVLCAAVYISINVAVFFNMNYTFILHAFRYSFNKRFISDFL